MLTLVHTADGKLESKEWWYELGTTVRLIKEGGVFSKDHADGSLGEVVGVVTASSIGATRRRRDKQIYLSFFIKRKISEEIYQYGEFLVNKDQVEVID